MRYECDGGISKFRNCSHVCAYHRPRPCDVNASKSRVTKTLSVRVCGLLNSGFFWFLRVLVSFFINTNIMYTFLISNGGHRAARY